MNVKLSIAVVLYVFLLNVRRCLNTSTTSSTTSTNTNYEYNTNIAAAKDYDRGAAGTGSNLTLIFKWNLLDFEWPSKEVRVRYLNESRYVPENCMIRDFKLWKEWAYFSLPRWKPGVPATLARASIVNDDGGSSRLLPMSPNLRAYPSWSAQTLDDCFALQSVHAIDIDDGGKLWILDAGVVEQLSGDGDSGDGGGHGVARCPPKILIVDLRTNFVVKHAVVPADVRRSNSRLTSMTVERVKQIAYIADSNSLGSAFVVFDLARNTFKRYACEQLAPADDYFTNNYNLRTIPPYLGVEFVSVSLNTARDKLYFSPFDSSDLLYLNVTTFSIVDDDDVSGNVVDLGNNGRGVKLISDTRGYMYFNTVNQKIVSQWRESSWVFQYTPRILVQTKLFCHWISSMDVDDEGYLWVASNRFHDYVNDRIRVEKENIRVFRVRVPRKEKPKRPKDGFNAEYVVLVLFIVIIALIIIEILMFNSD